MKKISKIFIKFNNLFFHIYIFIFFPYKIIECCDRENPILKNYTCNSMFCSKDEFLSNECKIDNEIIKTQWLNNFMNLEISYLRYVNFASYSNGDMILQSGAFPSTQDRYFIGFKNNGRAFFINNETKKSNYYYGFKFKNSDNSIIKYESQNIIIKISGKENNKMEEYLLSISKENSNVEI